MSSTPRHEQHPIADKSLTDREIFRQPRHSCTGPGSGSGFTSWHRGRIGPETHDRGSWDVVLDACDLPVAGRAPSESRADSGPTQGG
eukprot:3190138-Rhodomonas_salina.3